MYRNSFFPKSNNIPINLITPTVTVAHDPPFGQTKMQVFEMNRVNSAANIKTAQRLLIQTLRNL
jgi:hypothetical protein